jgi:hypothetical protein
MRRPGAYNAAIAPTPSANGQVNRAHGVAFVEPLAPRDPVEYHEFTFAVKPR